MSEDERRTSISITLKDVYEDVVHQARFLETMDKKLDTISANVDNNRRWLQDHENRIRSLEKLVWRASGIAAFIGAAAGTAVNLLSK